MPVYYGDRLYFSGYSGVGRFRIVTEMDVPEFYASGSRGGIIRPAGAKRWSGTALFLTPMNLAPGTAVNVVAAMDSSGRALQGQAKVSGLIVSCDAARTGLMSWQVAFFGDSPLRTGAAGAQPAPPRIPSLINPSVQIDNQSPPLQSWRVSFATMPKRYLAAGNEGWVRHVLGGFDATVEVVTIGDDVLQLDPGRFYAMTLSDGAGNSYVLRWVRPVEQANEVDPNSDIPPGVAFTLRFSAVNDQGVIGECLINGTKIWPVT
ncbi:MAG: hypothetical protein RML36_15290 [Anaerolineae bacterium]|nr:hypothetical protein [Anaerolineae bacterium]